MLTIKLRSLVGLLLIAAGVYVQIAQPDIHWPWPVVIDGDAPIKEPGLHIVVFHESQDAKGGVPDYWNATATGSVFEWLEKNAKGNWRLIDKDNDLTMQPEWVKQGRASYDAKSTGKIPWLVYSNGKKGGSVALPATAVETLSLLNGVLK